MFFCVQAIEYTLANESFFTAYWTKNYPAYVLSIITQTANIDPTVVEEWYHFAEHKTIFSCSLPAIIMVSISMQRQRPKKGIKSGVEAEFAKELSALLSPAIANGLDLENLETEMRKIALRTAARFLEEAVNADKSDYAGPETTCIFCGCRLGNIERRSKRHTTILGEIHPGRRLLRLPDLRPWLVSERLCPGLWQLLIIPWSHPHDRPGGVGRIMFWSVRGANAIIALRCSLLSDRFDEFWTR